MRIIGSMRQNKKRFEVVSNWSSKKSAMRSINRFTSGLTNQKHSSKNSSNFKSKRDKLLKKNDS
ncbi:hypothetical protein D3C86_2153760 [compost metagenome]